MIKATIQGLPDIREALLSIPEKLRKRALRNALAAGARVVQKEARRKAPTLDMGNAFSLSMYRRGYRKPGTLVRAISVRTSRMAARRGNVGVFVNVRPVKGTRRGALSAHDPYYWRWVNFGWRPAGGRIRKAGAGFLQAGAAMLGAALTTFKAAIGPQIAKLNKPKAPAP